MNAKAVIELSTNNLLRYGYESFIIDPLIELIIETNECIGKKVYNDKEFLENNYLKFHRWDGTQFYEVEKTV